MSTNIEWTDETWNPVSGCTKVSQGCKNCYAERLWPKVSAAEAKREGLATPRPFTKVRCHPDRLQKPLGWREPRRIFVNSMSDLFHEDVPVDFIAEVFGMMAVCGAREHDWDAPNNGRFGAKYTQERGFYDWKGPHTFQVLTKRPQRMFALMTSSHFRSKIASAAYACDRTDCPHQKRSATGTTL